MIMIMMLMKMFLHDLEDAVLESERLQLAGLVAADLRLQHHHLVLQMPQIPHPMTLHLHSTGPFPHHADFVVIMMVIDYNYYHHECS
jgi:hypothetical protein